MQTLPDGSVYMATVLGTDAEAALQGRVQVILPVPKDMQVFRLVRVLVTA